MRVYGGTNMGGIFLAVALVTAVFLYGSAAWAQSPIDDQYGSPTEIGVPGAVGSENATVDSSGTDSGAAGTGVSQGADATAGTGVSQGAGATGGTGAASSASGTDVSSSAGTASGSGGQGPGSVLAAALPATGGPLLPLVGLVALALVGTGLIVLRRGRARG